MRARVALAAAVEHVDALERSLDLGIEARELRAQAVGAETLERAGAIGARELELGVAQEQDVVGQTDPVASKSEVDGSRSIVKHLRAASDELSAAASDMRATAGWQDTKHDVACATRPADRSAHVSRRAGRERGFVGNASAPCGQASPASC